jgi:hypothetical protein
MNRIRRVQGKNLPIPLPGRRKEIHEAICAWPEIPDPIGRRKGGQVKKNPTASFKYAFSVVFHQGPVSSPFLERALIRILLIYPLNLQAFYFTQRLIGLISEMLCTQPPKSVFPRKRDFILI